jgi:hypothetical protein
MSPLSSRVVRIEDYMAGRPAPPLSPRTFVVGIVLAAWRGDRNIEGRCPGLGLDAFINLLHRDPEGLGDVVRLERALWVLLREHGADPVHTGPSERNVAAMQELLDGVPPHWRDDDLPSVWWPRSPAEMWGDEPMAAPSQ